MPTLTKPASTTWTTLWRVIARDGSGVACTTDTRAITYASVTYTPAALRPSQQQLIDNLDPSNLEIVIPLIQGGVTEQELLDGKWNAARVEVHFYDHETSTVKRTWKGVLNEIDMNNGRLKVEALDIAVLLNQPIGDLYQETCRADLGDAKCGKTPVTSASKTVATVVSRREFVINSYTLPAADSTEAGYFDYGIVTFTSGANNTLTKEIKTAVQEGANVRVKLVESMRGAIEVGNTLTLKEGCDGRFPTCIKKLNAARFRAEPNIPGLYKLLKFPST